MDDQLRGSLEENIITMLCYDERNSFRLTLELTPDLFSTRAYKRIAEVAIEYIVKFNAPPKAHLADLLEDRLRRGDDEGTLLRRHLVDMEKLAPEMHADYVLSQLERFISMRKMSNALTDASDALQKGELEKAREALQASDFMPQQSSEGIWLSDADSMLSFLEPREDDYFPSGIEVLDRRGVRPYRGQLFMFIGSKGIGKSWWLVQMGKEAILHRRSVLHITLENSEELTAKRYVQALFAMSTHAEASIRVPMFKRDSLGRYTSLEFETRSPDILNFAARHKVAKRLAQLKTRAPLLIKGFPTGDLTVAQINSYLDSLARTHNFKPDLLLLDQAFNLRFDSRDTRLAMGRSLIQLRGLAVQRSMAVVSPWQGNRDSDSASVVTAGMIAEDWSLGGTADTICTISRTAKERESGLARILVDKARDAPDKFLVLIAQSYETGQFALESDYMTKFVADDVNRAIGGENG